MKPYIVLNTKLRTAAKSKLEKNFFKLLSNSAFGKAMENITNQTDMKLVKSREKYAKYVMKPNFKDRHPFSKKLVVVEMGKTEIKMNKSVNLTMIIRRPRMEVR